MSLVASAEALSFAIRRVIVSLQGIRQAGSDAEASIEFVQRLPNEEAAVFVRVLSHPVIARAAAGGRAPADFFAAPQFRALGAFAADPRFRALGAFAASPASRALGGTSAQRAPGQRSPNDPLEIRLETVRRR